MDGQKYDWKMYEWEPVVDQSSVDAYFQTETPPADIAAAAGAPLAAPIVVVPPESVLSRPVGELLTAAVGDSVLARPVGELLVSAREAVSDTLHKPVGDVLRDALGRRGLTT
ncbi:MAG TPA: hypothetical protein VNA14_12670 [Mycobacteriales bacterium]|nr:hypothetical protein [Mycobacteriales bacterium]